MACAGAPKLWCFGPHGSSHYHVSEAFQKPPTVSICLFFNAGNEKGNFSRAPNVKTCQKETFLLDWIIFRSNFMFCSMLFDEPVQISFE